jgi:hypothetical protein
MSDKKERAQTQGLGKAYGKDWSPDGDKDTGNNLTKEEWDKYAPRRDIRTPEQKEMDENMDKAAERHKNRKL